MDIVEFKGENRWLSNFWPAKVELDGVIYPSVENAYQAAKTFPSSRNFFISCSAGEAKKKGREVTMVEDWENIKLSVMDNLIKQKFAPNTELGDKLKDTGDCTIIEGNWWRDTYWGVCKGVGENNLGKLIMKQRNYLQEEK